MGGPPSVFYRANFDRSISVIGEFSDDLAARVIPDILRLRHESNDPITVFIHSPGGQVNTLEGIDRALQTTHYGIVSPRIITVAVGDVSSAASSLLALGDYAIAYPRADILFHGVRVGEVQVTVEGAQNMAGRLQRLNRKISQRIAHQIMPRVMFRFMQLRSSLKKTGKLTPDECVELFERAIASRVGPSARGILRRTCRKVKGAFSLSSKIVPGIKFGKSVSQKVQDAKVLRAVLKHELESAKGVEWEIDEAGAQQLIDDYLLLRSWHVAQSDQTFVRAIEDYGPDFFSPSEMQKYKALKQSNEHEARGFLQGVAAPWIAQIWYFTTTLSSNLFVGENQVTSQDAYWLGLVDEVMGVKLKCERSVVEDKAKPPHAAPQPPATPPTATSPITTAIAPEIPTPLP